MDISLTRKLYIDVKDTPTSSVRTTITTGIEEGTASISQILFSEENICLGSYNASKFEVTLYGIEISKNDFIQVYFYAPSTNAVAGLAIAGIAVVGTDIVGNLSGKTYLFTGYVESITKESANPVSDGIHIIAYDELYYLKDRTKFGNQTISQWWSSLWASDWPNDPTPSTIGVVRNSLCALAGLSVASGYDDPTNGLLNNDVFVPPKVYFKYNNDGTSHTVEITPISSDITFSQMLTWICEMQFTFPHINGSGVLEFIDLTKTNTHDIVGRFELDSSDVEIEESEKIGPVRVVLNGKIVDSENPTIPVSVEYPNNPYTISDNLFMELLWADSSFHTDLQVAVGEIATSLYSVSYYPATLNMICSDANIKLGDTVIFYSEEDPENPEASPITKVARVVTNNFSGPLLVEQSIESSGKNNFELNETTGSSAYDSQEETWDMHVEPYYWAKDDYAAVSVPTHATTNDHTNLCSFELPQGLWVVQVAVQFSQNNDGLRTVWVSTSNNGSSMGIRFMTRQNAAGSGGYTWVQFTTIMQVAQSSRTFYVVGQQNSGSTLSVVPRVAFFGNKEK